MLRNRSCPAVSHSWSLTLVPSTVTFFVTKNAPVVDVVFLGSNLPWVYLCRRLVLPTPAQRVSSGEAAQRKGTALPEMKRGMDGPVLPMMTIFASTPWSYLAFR